MKKDEIDNMRFSFEEKFNKLFFSKDFIGKMTAEYHYCPQGLTFEPYCDEDSEEWAFCACCKKYNYDYSGLPENGDYIVLKTEIKNEWALFMFDYVEGKDKELADKIRGKIYFYRNKQ